MDVYNPTKHRLEGEWLITAKIDGVQAIYSAANPFPTSRAGKRLYNLPPMPLGVYEVFLGSWSETIETVRASKSKREVVPVEKLYRLEPKVDSRLEIRRMHLGFPISARHKFVMNEFSTALKKGYEGLVLHGPNGERLKVKNKETYDVKVLQILEGKGKHKGRMGALVTEMGKVGTGFSDDERRHWWKAQGHLTGCADGPGCEMCLKLLPIIEVECMELTEDGKFRHPRFVRLREDKA